MNYNTISLFKIEIHKFSIKEWKSKKDDILSLVPFDNEECTGLINYTDFHAIDEKPYQKEFFSLLEPYLSEFRKNCAYQFKEMPAMWCQRYYTNEYHPPHDHGAIGYSAVFYASLDNKVHDSTLFYSPLQGLNGMREDPRSITVSEGDLIIFPANLLHMAPAHQSEKERTIISFNLL